MEKLFVIFALLLFSFLPQARAQDLTAKQIAQNSFPSVVLLITEDIAKRPKSLGSGFFVTSELIVTNNHVIEGASGIYAKIINKKGLFKITEVVRTDKSNDLALLKVKGTEAHPLPLCDEAIEVGEELFVIGNPEGLEGTISQGIVSALRGYRRIQITAPISHGSSGSPVLNKRGEVIGVAVGAYRGGQNLNFAIRVEHVHILLSAYILSSKSGERLTNPANSSSVAHNTDARKKKGRVSVRKSTGAMPPPTIAPPDYAERGERLCEAGKFVDANEAFKRAIQLHPKESTVFMQLGRCLIKQDNFYGAIEALKMGVQTDPGNAILYDLLGVCYVNLNRYQEALGAFRKATELDPDVADYHNKLGVSYIGLRRFKEAEEAIRQGIRMEPKADYYYDLGFVLSQQRLFDDAIEAFQEALNRNPRNSDAYVSIGFAYRMLGKNYDAIRSYEKAIQIKPDQAEAHYQIGLMNLEYGDKNLALERYKQLKKIDPQKAEQLFNQIYK